MMTTWRELLSEAGVNFAEWYTCTLTEDELDKKFYTGYGLPEGEPFLLWTKDYVYFPIIYNDADMAERIPRNPSNETVGHLGNW